MSKKQVKHLNINIQSTEDYFNLVPKKSKTQQHTSISACTSPQQRTKFDKHLQNNSTSKLVSECFLPKITSSRTLSHSRSQSYAKYALNQDLSLLSPASVDYATSSNRTPQNRKQINIDINSHHKINSPLSLYSGISRYASARHSQSTQTPKTVSGIKQSSFTLERILSVGSKNDDFTTRSDVLQRIIAKDIDLQRGPSHGSSDFKSRQWNQEEQEEQAIQYNRQTSQSQQQESSVAGLTQYDFDQRSKAESQSTDEQQYYQSKLQLPQPKKRPAIPRFRGPLLPLVFRGAQQHFKVVPNMHDRYVHLLNDMRFAAKQLSNVQQEQQLISPNASNMSLALTQDNSPSQHEIFVVYFTQSSRYSVFSVISTQIPQILPDAVFNYSKALQATRQILETCQKEFRLRHTLNYLFLADESPICLFNDISKSDQVVIVSASPAVSFWNRVADNHNLTHFQPEKIRLLGKKLNSLKSVKQIQDFLNKPDYFRLAYDKLLTDVLQSCPSEAAEQEQDQGEEMIRLLREQLASQRKINCELEFLHNRSASNSINAIAANEQRLIHKMEWQGAYLQPDQIDQEQHLIERLASFYEYEQTLLNSKQRQLELQEKLRNNEYYLQYQRLDEKNVDELLKKYRLEQLTSELKAKQIRQQLIQKVLQDDEQHAKTAAEKRLPVIQSFKAKMAALRERRSQIFDAVDNFSLSSNRGEKSSRREGYQDPYKGLNSISNVLDILENKDTLLSRSKDLKKPPIEQVQPRKREQKLQWLDADLANAESLTYQQIKKKDFILANRQCFNMLKYEVQKHYPSLVLFNIPLIMKKTSFSREQLHNLFAKFKALIMYDDLYRHRGPHEKRYENGITFDTFKMGVDVLMVTPDAISHKIFNSQKKAHDVHEEVMRWETYIKTLDLIAARSLQSKIELFMELMDENRTGAIEYDEIFRAGKFLLEKIFSRQKHGVEGVDDLAHFLTRTIFKAVGIEENEKIVRDQLMQKLVESVAEGSKKKYEHSDLDFLFMICIAQSSELQGYDTEEYDESENARNNQYHQEVLENNRIVKLVLQNDIKKD